MADIPAGVNYGKVEWFIETATADSDDPGNVPDTSTVNGTVTLTPSVSYINFPSLPDPETIRLVPIQAQIINGHLVRPGATDSSDPGVYLVATDQPGANPNKVQWTATFNLIGLTAREQPPKIVFNVPAGGVVDLATVVPQVPAPGTIVVVDESTRLAAEEAAQAAADALAQLIAGVGPAVEAYLLANPPVGEVDGVQTIDITDATTLSRQVIQATTADAIRTLIGAGTSSLGLGGTGSASTAMRSDWRPLVADIIDADPFGRQIIQAATAAAVRALIGAGTSSLALGGTGSATTAMRSDWRPAAADISDSTAFGQSLVKATSAANARSLLGVPDNGGSIYVVKYSGGSYPTQPTTPPAGVTVRYFYGPVPYSGAAWAGVLDRYEYAPLT